MERKDRLRLIKQVARRVSEGRGSDEPLEDQPGDEIDGFAGGADDLVDYGDEDCAPPAPWYAQRPSRGRREPSPKVEKISGAVREKVAVAVPLRAKSPLNKRNRRALSSISPWSALNVLRQRSCAATGAVVVRGPAAVLEEHFHVARAVALRRLEEFEAAGVVVNRDGWRSLEIINESGANLPGWREEGDMDESDDTESVKPSVEELLEGLIAGATADRRIKNPLGFLQSEYGVTPEDAATTLFTLERAGSIRRVDAGWRAIEVLTRSSEPAAIDPKADTTEKEPVVVPSEPSPMVGFLTAQLIRLRALRHELDVAITETESQLGALSVPITPHGEELVTPDPEMSVGPLTDHETEPPQAAPDEGETLRPAASQPDVPATEPASEGEEPVLDNFPRSSVLLF